MGILAVYDTVGIQNYIFSSNKMAENVGASKLVADIFKETLPKVISEETGEELFYWKEHAAEALSDKLTVEVIFQGGGNAYVKFIDKGSSKAGDLFQSVTREFLTQVSLEARGVGIAVAAIETDFSDTYKSDFKKLNDRLALAKGSLNIPVFAGNQPITKQSGRTGLPVSVVDRRYNTDEFLSRDQELKRKKYDKYKMKAQIEIENFDDLAFDEGVDSLIAIIHADGNNMGRRIIDYMEKFKTYNEAVPEIRGLSKKIDECYGVARENTISAFKEEYASYLLAQKKKYPGKSFNEKTPILELIGDGDDTTIIICGRFAIDFAKNLLLEIEKTKEDNKPFPNDKPTACAGVVIFNKSYPFSEAYKLVEELCSSAKKPSRDNEGSYLDFHLHYSGGVSGLKKLRKLMYEVDGKTILRRPWCVSKDMENETPNFKWFEESILKIADMPHNKIKAIRNAIGAGDKAAKLAVNQLRGLKLPEFALEPDEKRSSYAALFDILEMLDCYVNLLSKGGKST